MKYKYLLFLFFFTSYQLFSQDTLTIKLEIDSIVNSINHSNYEIEQDTITVNKPEIGINITTYITLITHESKIKKYEQTAISLLSYNSVITNMTAKSIFYFDKNKLIKVEEFMIENERKMFLDFYFKDNVLLYSSTPNEQAKERANLLLIMAENFLKLKY